MSTVRVRLYPSEPDSTIELDIDELGTVHYQDQRLGAVSSYEGTLDRPLSRHSMVVRRGKRRTLWAGGGLHDVTTRAEVLRHLLHRAGIKP